MDTKCLPSKKKNNLTKHGNHEQKDHGKWSAEFGDDGEETDTEGLHPRHSKTNVSDDEGEFGNLNDDDDMEAMDDMDILRPAKPESYYQEISQRLRERKK